MSSPPAGTPCSAKYASFACSWPKTATARGAVRPAPRAPTCSSATSMCLPRDCGSTRTRCTACAITPRSALAAALVRRPAETPFLTAASAAVWPGTGRRRGERAAPAPATATSATTAQANPVRPLTPTTRPILPHYQRKRRLAAWDLRRANGRSGLDGDERPDRCVRPDLGCGLLGQLDTAETLRRPERGAWELVERVAAVEIADPADSRVVVVGAVGVRAAHRANRNVLEHGPCPLSRRRGGDAGVAGRGEDDVAVVPEAERLRQSLVDEDVAVAGVGVMAREIVVDQPAPDLGPGDAVGRHSVLLLEAHHGALRDDVPGARVPERLERRGSLRIPPGEGAARCPDRGRNL